MVMKIEKKEKYAFNLILGVSFLLIAALGITYAYFTGSTSGEENNVKVKSSSLKLRYISYESAWSNKKLIPALTPTVEYSFEYQNDTTISNLEDKSNSICVDDNGNTICSIYVFQIKNITDAKQILMMELYSSTNGFSNLHSMLYELDIEDKEKYEDNSLIPDTGSYNGISDPVFYKTPKEIEEDASSGDAVLNKIGVLASDGNLLEDTIGNAYLDTGLQSKDPNYVYYTPIYVNRDGVKKQLLTYKNEDSKEKLSLDIKVPPINEKVKLAENISIEKNETKTFALVIYIKDNSKEQADQDGSKTFAGTILINKGDGTYMISGTISNFEEESLESISGEAN